MQISLCAREVVIGAGADCWALGATLYDIFCTGSGYLFPDLALFEEAPCNLVTCMQRTMKKRLEVMRGH